MDIIQKYQTYLHAANLTSTQHAGSLCGHGSLIFHSLVAHHKKATISCNVKVVKAKIKNFRKGNSIDFEPISMVEQNANINSVTE